MIHSHQTNSLSKQYKRRKKVQKMFKVTNKSTRTTSSEIFWVSGLKYFNADVDIPSSNKYPLKTIGTMEQSVKYV